MKPDIQHRATLEWSYPTHQGVHALEYANGRYIFPAHHSKLVCVDADSGQEIWRSSVAFTYGDLSIDSDHACYASGVYFYVFSMKNGKTLYENPTPRFQRWLCLYRSSVLMGGWRGYSEIVHFSVSDQRIMWSKELPKHTQRVAYSGYPNIAALHTSIYAPLEAAAVLWENGVLNFFALKDGSEIQSLELIGLAEEYHDDLSVKSTSNIVIRKNQTEFYHIHGNPVLVDLHDTRENITTYVLKRQNDDVFFQNDRKQLCCYSLELRQTKIIGLLDNARDYLLSVVRLEDQTIIAGTAQGLLIRYRPEGGMLSRQKVCKRVLTPLFARGNVVCFGTQSGSVMAWRFPPRGPST